MQAAADRHAGDTANEVEQTAEVSRSAGRDGHNAEDQRPTADEHDQEPTHDEAIEANIEPQSGETERGDEQARRVSEEVERAARAVEELLGQMDRQAEDDEPWRRHGYDDPDIGRDDGPSLDR